MLLAERLRMLRAQKDWTLDELAQRAGVSRLTIHRAERGSERITAPMIMALAKAFHVTTDYLLGVTGLPPKGGSLSVPASSTSPEIPEG